MISQKKSLMVVFLASLAILMIALSGCGGLSSSDRDDNTDADYRSGSQGLQMRFLSNNPPYRLYDTDPLSIVLELENRGATDISTPSGRIYISGFDNDIVTGISTQGANIDQLEGKSLYNPDGGYDTVEFMSTIRNLGSKDIDKYDATILATACYKYETEASPAVCVDGDPYSTTSSIKVCTPSSVSAGTQGAPIAVTSVDVESMPRKTQFKIHISNIGGGTVFKDGASYISKCNPYDSRGLEYNDVNFVRLQDIQVGSVSIKSSCKPLSDNDYVRLVDGQGMVICTLNDIREPAYTTPLRVKLTYGYRDSISTHVEIVRTAE